MRCKVIDIPLASLFRDQAGLAMGNGEEGIRSPRRVQAIPCPTDAAGRSTHQALAEFGHDLPPASALGSHERNVVDPPAGSIAARSCYLASSRCPCNRTPRAFPFNAGRQWSSACGRPWTTRLGARPLDVAKCGSIFLRGTLRQQGTTGSRFGNGYSIGRHDPPISSGPFTRSSAWIRLWGIRRYSIEGHWNVSRLRRR